MAIEYKDYYQTLRLTRAASDDDIRSAFRRLARAFHPDKTGNDATAEDQFKEINEAYEVLGDPVRRQRYDEFVGAWTSGECGPGGWENFVRHGTASPDFARASGRAGSREHYSFDGAGFSDFFQQLFGNRRAAEPRKTERTQRKDDPADLRGDDLESDIWVTLQEVTTGAIRPITMNRAVKCPACLGMGQYNAHPCEKCDGKGSLLHSDTYKVKIPRGVREGAFLRVAGRGEQGLAEGPPGDLFLKVHYAAHLDFRIEHGTLVHDLQLAPWEAVLGATVSVPTLDGRATVKVPAGTRNGCKLRLKGRGIPGADGTSGDLILAVRVQVPAGARSRERELWQELANECHFMPREN